MTLSIELIIGILGAAATIIAAFIGIIVAVTTAVISKEQKVSEFRREWINEMQKDVASLLTIYNDCIYHVKNSTLDNLANKTSNLDENNHLKSNLFKLLEYSSSIKFRLNPKSDQALIKKINKIRETIAVISSKRNKDDIRIAFVKAKLDIEELETEFHNILKHEWERVKKGERKFVAFRSFGEVCLFAFITAFFVALAFIKIPELSHYLVDLCVIKKGT